MDWQDLLCDHRLRDKHYTAQPNRSIFVQDHDRIVFSAPFRRLDHVYEIRSVRPDFINVI
ncbi:hypothetical protein [Rhodospirillum sp. A1_3_36]|uniref:hypothetical protein n=1 Tax=Rhodospirillum sp. A1_3_36 TaxID=3391666 RepID=UPI0039A58019